MWSHNIEPSETHDVQVVVTYTDDIYSTSYAFQLNHVDFYGTIDEHIEYHLVQPTVYGTPKEIMISDVEKLKIKHQKQG